MENVLENGVYDAVFNGNASVYDSKKGNLTVCFELMIGDIQRKVFCTMTKDNGKEINERQIEKLKAIFKDWDGDDPSWFLEPDNVRDVACEARVENETDARGNTWSNVKDVQAVGAGDMEGGDVGMPPSLDAKALQAKYGAKFRALASKKGKAVKPTNHVDKPNKAKDDDQPS